MPPDSDPIWSLALRHITHPSDGNHQGSVFGGVIMSMIDQASYVEARRHGVHRWLTVAIEKIEFEAPVWMGDMVTCWTKVARFGTTSLTVQVRVEAERFTTGDAINVTHATVTMVATNAAGKPIPFRSPPSLPIATTSAPQG
ncbi:MAG: acyl-CoA thioesterase [Phycisphaerales bacterium]|nr:acyl-CoA thioesterase [Phycisphaerales bacterium]